MYLQLTTACNMSCDHCIFGCAANKRGEYMSRETFDNCMEFADYEEFITFGGGEPTLHPRFWEFFGKVMANEYQYLWMATNGKKKDMALALAGIAEGHPRFSLALSQDPWHEPIDMDVVWRFERSSELEVRTVKSIVHGGSAPINGVATQCYEDGCDCADLWFVKPNGDVSLCACLDSPVIGNINTHNRTQLEYIAGELIDLEADGTYDGDELGCWRKWTEAQLNFLTEEGIPYAKPVQSTASTHAA